MLQEGWMEVFERKWYRALAGLLAAAYMGLIYWLSSRPPLELPHWFRYQDKLFHLAEYHVLGFLLAHAIAGGTHKRRFWIAFALASVYALTDAFHCSFVPGRIWSPLDWAAAAAGAWLGAYLYLRSENVLKK
jgi:VanZ family protein